MFFSFNDNKALDPDGFNALFFKKAWPIVRQDMTPVVMEFFSIGHY